jgi:type III pantothenate kinase
MILELDAGNSRIKWRILHEGESRAAGAAATLQELAAQWHGQRMTEVSRLRVSSVRGREFADELEAMVMHSWQLLPEFAVVSRQAAGVTNTYEDPIALGVDRWLAMLAAFHRTGSACCILDCGSAITYDWLNARGEHQGGYIVPGMQLMRQSMAKKTRALEIAFEDWGEPVPGKSTRAAIGNGILAMVCGFAEHCRQGTSRAAGGADARWFLTGGDAEVVGRHLGHEHVIVADLVLDGLALVLP